MSSAKVDAPGAYPITPSADEMMGTQHQSDAPRTLGDDGVATSKPGVMTGAHSRVGHHAQDSTGSGNYTYGSNPLSTTGEAQQGERYNDQPASTAAGGVPSSSTATGSNNFDNSTSDATSATEPQEGSGRNIVRNGLREKSNVEHENPYWGSMPTHQRGTGIYNTVTGHGSDESPGHMRTLSSEKDHEDISATGQRSFPLTTDNNTHEHSSRSGQPEQHNSHFKEGVAGTGAAAAGAYGAHELSQRGHSRQEPGTDVGRNEPFTAEQNRSYNQEHKNDHAYQLPTAAKHRTEPVGSAYSDPENRSAVYQSETHGHNPRHGKEALAGATAAYAAHEHSQNKNEDPSAIKHHQDSKDKKDEKHHSFLHKDKSHDDKKEKVKEEEHPKEKKESKLAALFHRGHKDKHDDAEKRHEKPSNEKLSHEEVARKVDPVTEKAYSEAQLASPARDQHTTSHQRRSNEDESNRRKYEGVAAATAAAGAGAYGAHKYADREHEPEKSREPITSAMRDNKASSHSPTSHSGPMDSMRHEQGTQRYAEPTNTTSAGRRSGDHDGQYNKLHSGTPSGIHGRESSDMHSGDQARGSSDSSRGGKYNVLSSGTPSGINLGDDTTSHNSPSAPLASHHERHAQQPSSGLGDKAKYGAAGAAAAGAGYGAERAYENRSGNHEYENKDDINNGRQISGLEDRARDVSQRKADETGPSHAGAMQAQDGYAPSRGNKPLIHKCHKCGEENDISGYLKA